MREWLGRPSIWLAMAGIGLAVSLVLRQRVVEPAPAPVVAPSSAPFPDTIGARGILEAVDENVRVAPAVAGLVSEVRVKVGDLVKQGDLLFSQDNREAESERLAQEAAAVALEAALKEAEVSVADRTDQWQRMEQLGVNRVASVEEKQRTLFALRSAEARLTSARAQLEASRALSSRARTRCALLEVRAPRDGTVLQVNIRAGEYLVPGVGEQALLLGQIQELQLRADVDEDNATRVKPGCSAVAYVKGQRLEGVPLRFVRIEPYIVPKRALAGESSERVDTRVLQVIFRLERPQIPLYVGQQMDVFLNGSTQP
jgi:RND family efflux transporter MFP subunit